MKKELAALKSSFETETAKLHQTDRRIAASVVRLEAKVDRIEDRLADMATKDDVSRIIGHIVAFTKDVEAAQRDRALSSDAYMRHQDRLEDHEKRLSRLESKKS